MEDIEAIERRGIDAAIQEVEKAALAKSTHTRYNSNNFAYIRWLLKKRPHLLHEQLKEELVQIESQQLTPTRKRKAIRNLIVDVWLGHGETYNGVREPICCGDLVYDDVVTFFVEQKHPETGRYNYSKSWFVGHLSALTYLFRTSGFACIPAEMSAKLSLFMKGMRKTIVRDKIDAGESIIEGKKEMSYECLQLLCKLFAEGKNPAYAFAWPFLLLEWNLIARSNSVCMLCMNDIEWRDDSLILFLRKTKTDQEGREAQTPYHNYFQFM